VPSTLFILCIYIVQLNLLAVISRR